MKKKLCSTVYKGKTITVSGVQVDSGAVHGGTIETYQLFINTRNVTNIVISPMDATPEVLMEYAKHYIDNPYE